jgi:hypothetical protein
MLDDQRCEHCRRRRVAATDGVEQIFGLVPELLEIRTKGKTTIGHDGPPRSGCRRPHAGKKEVRGNRTGVVAQVDSVLSADGWRPARQA